MPGPASDPPPRLLATPERITELRCTRDPATLAIRNRVLAKAESLLAQDLITEPAARQGGGQHANFHSAGHQLVDAALHLGIAWQVTRDDRYARRLRESLLHYCSFEQWLGPHCGRNLPPWHSELSNAILTYGVANGYDLLRGFLTPDERRRIADALVRLGIQPALDDWLAPQRRIHCFDSMGHNWWVACVAMAGFGALALADEDPRVSAWLEQIERGLQQWCDYRGNVLQRKPANFDPAGAFYESVGYANYAIGELLLFRIAHRRTCGARPQLRLEILDHTSDFFVHTIYPTANGVLNVNFGDSQLHQGATHAARLFGPAGLADDAARWYLQRVDPVPDNPLSLLCPTHGPASTDGLPRSKIYPDIGWAMLRSGWHDDATLLAVKSGMFWNHAHADAGHFILFHAGQPLIIDSGTCAYGHRQYVDYYVQSRAHNVILCDGQGQTPEDFLRGSTFSGRVHSLLDHADVKYVYADATGPMARHCARNFRHWLWLDGIILVIDEVRTHQAVVCDWLLHHAGTADLDGPTVHLANGAARATVRMLFPEAVAVSTREGLRDHEPEQPAPYFAFVPAEPAIDHQFITAIIPHGDGAAPGLELLHGEDSLGVRIIGPETITEVFFNLRADGRRMHQNSINTFDSWETDGYLVAMTRPRSAAAATPDTIDRYVVSGASYLRHHGRVVLDALSKVDAVFTAAGEPAMVVAGQPDFDLAVRRAEAPTAWRVNGHQVPFRYDSSLRMVHCRVQS